MEVLRLPGPVRDVRTRLRQRPRLGRAHGGRGPSRPIGGSSHCTQDSRELQLRHAFELQLPSVSPRSAVRAADQAPAPGGRAAGREAVPLEPRGEEEFLARR